MRKLRHRAGFSLEAAAFEADVNRSHLWDLESGRYEPGAYLLAKLASAYEEPYAQMSAWIERRAVFYRRQEQKRKKAGR